MNFRDYQQPSAPSPPPPPYESVVNQYGQGSNINPKLNQFIQRYEINPAFAERLQALKGYEIVFICDDSGSMSATIDESSNLSGQPFTRWDELKRTVSIVVDIANVFDPDGVDVYFLNREPMFHVRSSADLEILFAMAPEGATPMVPVLRQVLRDKRNQIYERKLLILIATDGIPTDERERPDIRTLEHVLREERQPINQIPVSFIVCTDDVQCMEYLNRWDKTIPNLDVIDDYRSERKEIQECRGKNFSFSFGDYVVKILLGSIDTFFDNWDEKNNHR